MNYNLKIEKCGVAMEQQVILKKETDKQKNLPLFILKIVGNVIFYMIIIALLLFSIMNIRAGNKVDGYPNIFGKGFLSVQTNSMKGDNEDSFDTGDLIIVSVFKEKKANDLKVGDVITFYDPTVNNNKGGLNSHRIVYINRDSNDNQSGNITSVVTQGDKSVKDYNWTFNPDSTDPNAPKRNQELLASNNAQTVQIKDIRGVMTSIWHGAGRTLDNIQKYWLFIFVLPVLLFLVFEIFMVAKNVMALKNEKKKSEIDPNNVIDIEAQKEVLRAQILAELQAEQEKQALEEAKEEIKNEEPVVENTLEPLEENKVEEAIEPQNEISEIEQNQEEAKEAIEEPIQEAKPLDEVAVVEPIDEPVEPQAEQAIEEPEKVVEASPAKPKTRTTAAKKPSTGAKKSASTTKKTTTTSKATTTKKPATKATSTTAKKSTTAAKSSTAKKTTGTKTSTAKKPATAKTQTGAKKTTGTTKKTTTKKTNTEVAKEKGE